FDQPGGTLVFLVLAALLVAASGSGAAHHAATGTTTGARATGRGRRTRGGATHARFGRTRGTTRTGSTTSCTGTHALGRTGGRTTATTGRAEPARRGRATQFAAVGRRPASGGPAHRPDRPHRPESGTARAGTRGGHARRRGVGRRARARQLALPGRPTRHRRRRHTRRSTPATAGQAADMARTATAGHRRATTRTTRIPRSTRRIRRTTRNIDHPGAAADTALVAGTGGEGRRLGERGLLRRGLVEVLVIGVHHLHGLLVGRVSLLPGLHGLVECADRVERVVLDRRPEVLHQPVGLDRLGHRVLRTLGRVRLRIRRLRGQLGVRGVRIRPRRHLVEVAERVLGGVTLPLVTRLTHTLVRPLRQPIQNAPDLREDLRHLVYLTRVQVRGHEALQLGVLATLVVLVRATQPLQNLRFLGELLDLLLVHPRRASVRDQLTHPQRTERAVHRRALRLVHRFALLRRQFRTVGVRGPGAHRALGTVAAVAGLR